jgi:hypothetical protein
MPEAEFEALTAQMAEIGWKYLHRYTPAASTADGRER